MISGADENDRHRPTAPKRTKRLAQVVFAGSLGVAVWLGGFLPGEGPEAVVSETAPQFSLDLEVLNTADHDVVYAVEQRARPAYRIFSLDPRSGEVETVFTVPEDAIVFGIALNPAGDTLAVAYSPDFELGGSGIWTLDLRTGVLDEQVPVTADVYLNDLSWSPDGEAVLATHVDRRGPNEELAVARIGFGDTSVSILVPDGIDPIQVGETVYYLTVDDTQARRAIGSIDGSGSAAVTNVGDGGHDLDHLLRGADDATVRVAILESVDGGLTVGEPAGAHGNHNVASTWWSVDLGTVSEPTATGLEPIIIYDAATNGDSIVSATNEGLAIGTTTRIELIASRAIRLVAQ